MPRLPFFKFRITLPPSDTAATDTSIELSPPQIESNPSPPSGSTQASSSSGNDQSEFDAASDLADVLRTLALEVTQEYIGSTRQGKRFLGCLQPKTAIQKGDKYVIVSFKLIDPYAGDMLSQDQEEFIYRYSTAQVYRQKISDSSSYTKRYRMSRLYLKHAEKLRDTGIRLSNKAKVAPILAKMGASASTPDGHQSSEGRIVSDLISDITDKDNPFRDPSLYDGESFMLAATASIISDDASERRFSIGSVPETLDEVED